MKTPGDYIALLLALAIFIVLGILMVFAVKFFIEQFHFLQSEATAQLIIISVLMIMCSFIIANAIKGHRSVYSATVSLDKSKLYADFITSYSNIDNENNIEVRGTAEFNNGMALWAGKDVLRAYMRFVEYSNESLTRDKKSLEFAEKVIFEMRKDIGIQNYGIRKGDLNKIVLMKKQSNPSHSTNDINKIS